MPDSHQVAPRAGAWIETITRVQEATAFRSLPARERGLKQLCSQILVRNELSLPARERGLKHNALTLDTDGASTSLPARERGLKQQGGEQLPDRKESLPARERGLKQNG